MKALCWHGKHDVRIDEVPEPKIVNPRDAIVRVTLAAICGSDLHLYNGYNPAMKPGDILGHEIMGEVVEVGPGVSNLSPGDRVVLPFPISCGDCWYCRNGQTALCDNSNPNSWMLEKMYGDTGAAIFGYSHLYGGYAGGQAEYVRVPYADFMHIKVPAELPDEKVLFLSDIFPTGYMAAENCSIQPGDTVAVWGCGPVGQFAMWSARKLGAGKVIGVDRYPDRLKMATGQGVDYVLDYEKEDVPTALHELTGGRGPDACIDAVGLEAVGTGLEHLYDAVKQTLRLETDRPVALRQAIYACRKGGTISIPGVYAGFIDKMPIGAVFGKGLILRGGQTHVHRYLAPLLEMIRSGEIDPSFVITHRMPLEEAPQGYRIFCEKQEECIKIVLTP